MARKAGDRLARDLQPPASRARAAPGKEGERKSSSIVTYVHHYKRPPPKKKAKPPIAVPAIVQRDAPKQPITTEPSSAIVTNKSQKQLKLLRRERAYAKALAIDDPEETARVRAFIKRMTRPPEK